MYALRISRIRMNKRAQLTQSVNDDRADHRVDRNDLLQVQLFSQFMNDNGTKIEFLLGNYYFSFTFID